MVVHPLCMSKGVLLIEVVKGSGVNVCSGPHAFSQPASVLLCIISVLLNVGLVCIEGPEVVHGVNVCSLHTHITLFQWVAILFILSTISTDFVRVLVS
jgi:hypothetical protein